MKTTMLAAVAAFFSLIYAPNDGLVISEKPLTPPLTPKGEPTDALPSDNLADFDELGSPLGVRGGVKNDFTADPTLPDYKARVIRDVFTRLKNAKGDYRSRRPYLHFVNDSGGGPAVAYPKTGLILLEEKAYDICASFGKDSLNALAVLLAHELVHCYEKHDWEEYFAVDFQQSSLRTAVSDVSVEDEIQADYLGGFLAYQAGFSTFGIMPQFLDKVYSTYNLPDEMASYPKKSERKTLADSSEQKMKILLDYFETANLLVAVEEYDDALEYYHKLLEDFQSREVYNNIGVLSTLSAMQRFTPLQNKYAYPVELDTRSRLGSRSADSEKAYREGLLLDAIEYFEKARQFDAFYPIAYLNQGCAHALLGISQSEFSELEWEDAGVAAERAIRLSKDRPEWANTLADAKVLLGILSALKNDAEGADRYFGEALQLDSVHFLAKKNRSIVKGETLQFPPTKTTVLGAETIGGMAFTDIKINTKSPAWRSVKSEDAHKVSLLPIPYDESRVLSNQSITGTGGQKVTKFTTFQLTIPGYDKPTSLGLKIGVSDAEVLAAYGEPSTRVSLGDGAWWRYKQDGTAGVIFQFRGHKLMGWSIYRQAKR